MRLRHVWLPVLVAVGFGAPSAMADPVGLPSAFRDGIAGVKVAMNGTSTEFPTCHKCRSLTRARLHGRVSFTNVGADKIGRITPKATITEFPTAVELSFRAS